MNDWFKEAFPERVVEMPPAFKAELDTEYTIIFKEKAPRNVSGGFRRITPVINIEHNGKAYSLYLSHVDLARRVRILENEHKDLLGLTVIINKKRGTKRNYLYDVKEVNK